MCAPPPFGALAVSDGVGELKELAEIIRGRHRALLPELRLEVVGGGIVLRGRAVSFYGKQVAQHEVQRRGLVILANNLAVLR